MRHIIRRSIALILFLFIVFEVFSQENIKVLIDKHPSENAGNFYLAGSFNNWNPKDEEYRFTKNNEGKFSVILKLQPGLYEYKVTRGGWDKVECNRDGSMIANRLLKVERDTTILLEIQQWADNIAAKPKVSTASRHVQIMDAAFSIPQLNRERRIWIYLPENYNTTTARFPVLYMHDGQNIFEDTTSYAGEWGIDEFLDTTSLSNCIVVAIDNSSRRINEYSPYNTERFGRAEGPEYLEFIVKNLKPYIDKHYRTRKNRQHTFIAGSSMGGLISMYAILKYPNIFGGAGVFSPAFWINPEIQDYIRANGKKLKGKVYFYAGKQESDEMVPDMQKAYKSLKEVSKARLQIVINENGKHNEATWRNEFSEFYYWLMNGEK